MVGSKILNMASGLDKLIPNKDHQPEGGNEESEEKVRNATAAAGAPIATNTYETIINTGGNGPASIKSGLSQSDEGFLDQPGAAISGGFSSTSF